MNKINGYNLSRMWFEFLVTNNDVTPNHTTLYHYLIYLCNSLGWMENFGLPTDMTMEKTKIRNYKTYKKVIEDLCQWGFIEMVTKSQNQYTSSVIKLKSGLVNLTEALPKAQPKPLPKPLPKSLPKASPNHCRHKQTTKNNKNIYKQENDENDVSLMSFEDVESKLLEAGEPFTFCDMKWYYGKYTDSTTEIKSPIKYIKKIIISDYHNQKLIRKEINKPKFIPSIPPEENVW